MRRAAERVSVCKAGLRYCRRPTWAELHHPNITAAPQLPLQKKKSHSAPATLSQYRLPPFFSPAFFPHSPKSLMQGLRHWAPLPNHCNIPFYFYLFRQSCRALSLRSGWFYLWKCTLLVSTEFQRLTNYWQIKVRIRVKFIARFTHTRNVLWRLVLET